MIRSLAALLLCFAASAQADEAGRFDYYVLSLSWSPTWCALEGDARRADQCDPRHDFGWTLHGLWPQNARGYPEYCSNAGRDPSRDQSDAMADVMGSGALAWHQWKKHGRCSGLSGSDYYAVSREAFLRVQRPAVLRKLTEPVRLPPKVVEDAFLEANPSWTPDMLTITCKNGRIQEARLCLSRDLSARVCGGDVRQDCTLSNALLDPIK